MAAAVSAATEAQKARFPCLITVLERNDRTAAKVRISGGGKCNVAHRGAPKEILEKGFLRQSEQRFLRPSLFAFNGDDLLALLHSGGVETQARPDGKIFPSSGNALSVVQVFENLMSQQSVDLRLSCRVTGVFHADGRFLVQTDTGGTLEADAVILASGGVSYARTGTTGDGLRIAGKFGHTLVTPHPALAPVHTVTPFPSALAGLSLRKVHLIALSGKARVERPGDVLFTHRGFSGPAVLSLSRDIAELHASGEVRLYADMFPEHEKEKLEKILLLQAREHGPRTVRKFLQGCPIAPPAASFTQGEQGTIPTAIVPYILDASAVPEDATLSTLTKEQRKSLLSVLKRFPLGMVRKVPLDEGEVSAGGVSLSEVDPKTMQSRTRPGLFLCGELLDYAGEIGGFNLQAAFSTGWLAGMHAALMNYPAQE